MSIDVLVVSEPRSSGGIDAAVDELIAAARLAADGGRVGVMVPAGEVVGDAEIASVGADVVYRVAHPRLEGDYASGVYDVVAAAASEVASGSGCRAVVLAKSDLGSVVGPRLSASVGAGFAADCVDLTLTAGGRIAVTRPVHGGNAMAVYEFAGTGVQVLTVRGGAFEAAERRGDGAADIEEVDLSEMGLSDGGATLLETVAEAVEGVPLESAEVVVAGGRGLGGPEPFEELRALCGILGGALGASRAACDAGWLDHSHQVGLTGKKISPRTYITVGISGASQHMAGCSSARNIVAINRDASASIFAHARFGVVGDWESVLPAFIATCADLAGDG